ncbi:MAG TPA: Wall-associated protein precursor [Archangium sp.]|uniref:Wall-associated protein precursor n=1 Tax=Archangium sp. TaxID=1872627 RepID=UPI002ED9CE70
MLGVLLLLLAQVPCAPNDLTVVCSCKQGVASACDTLRLSEPELAAKLEAAFQTAAAVQGARIAVEALKAEGETSPASPEPPECKGQLHHIISKRIAKALERHRILRGHYKPRDPRFISRAVDEKAHCGYGEWHRDVDDEVIAWLARYRDATPEQFEAYLREVYRRPDMLKRFPRGF